MKQKLYKVACIDDQHQFTVQSDDKDEVITMIQRHTQMKHQTHHSDQEISEMIQTI